MADDPYAALGVPGPGSAPQTTQNQSGPGKVFMGTQQVPVSLPNNLSRQTGDTVPNSIDYTVPQYMSADAAAAMFYTLDHDQMQALRQVAKASGQRDSGGTLQWLYQQGVQGSMAYGIKGVDISPLDYLKQHWAKATPGSGAYKGPVTTVTEMSEPDVRTLADTVASTVLGRGLNDSEYQDILKKVRGAEKANPSVAGAGTAYQTNQSGLSTQGRQDVVAKALLNENGAEDFTLATKMMSLYQKALQEQPNG